MQKPLRKSEKKRFEEVCSDIRHYLMLDTYRAFYSFEKEDKNNSAVVGRCHIHEAGDFCDITIYDCFWNQPYEFQLCVLIHEHIHCLLSCNSQFVHCLIERLHPGDKNMAEDQFRLVKERMTHHLESVLYDLLKDKFKT